MKLTNEIKLRLDEWSGEGDIVISDMWEKHDALFQADVLKDWIMHLVELYSDACEDMGRDGPTTIEFVKVTYDNS
jgi:hypothetical protein